MLTLQINPQKVTLPCRYQVLVCWKSWQDNEHDLFTHWIKNFFAESTVKLRTIALLLFAGIYFITILKFRFYSSNYTQTESIKRSFTSRYVLNKKSAFQTIKSNSGFDESIFQHGASFLNMGPWEVLKKTPWQFSLQTTRRRRRQRTR